MEDMQNQMNAILGNPEMMQKIMALAQSLNSPQPSAEKKEDNPALNLPDIDLGMIQKLSGLAGRSNIDNNQRSLLNALTPYLSRERIAKLEKAMRAARMASLASAFLGNSGFSLTGGR